MLLSVDEARLIRNLRELPDSPLRRRVVEAVQLLVALAKEPRCGEAQADGVPCGSVHASCEECLKLVGVLEGLVTPAARAQRPA